VSLAACATCRAYLQTMIDRVFGPSALFLVDKLKAPSKTGAPVNMEASFSQLTLDVIGKVWLAISFHVFALLFAP